MKSKRVGVIDIGTLKVKAEIAEISGGKAKTVFRSSVLTCLGLRMAENNNKPLPANLRKTLKELIRFKNIFKEQKTEDIRVVSTHAFREMGKEGEKLAVSIREKIGLPVEIISQKEEAELFFSAVMADFTTDEDFTVIDLGGGTLQALIGNKKRLKETHLLKMGAQFLHDTFSPRFTRRDCPTDEEMKTMEKYIFEQLSSISKDIKTPVIYGSACIIDAFRAIGLRMENFPHSPSHPHKVKAGELENFLSAIIPVPYGEREKRFPFRPGYMWGIDKAFLAVTSLCRRLSSPYIVPSNADISRGIILGMVKEN